MFVERFICNHLNVFVCFCKVFCIVSCSTHITLTALSLFKIMFMHANIYDCKCVHEVHEG